MKRRFWLGALLAATLISGTALVACGGDDDDDGSDTTPAASTQSAGATEPAGEPTEASGDATEPSDGDDDGIENLTVTATDFAFDADLTSVAPGSVVAVAFSNSGSAQHTLTFYTDDAYTEAIPGGDSDRVSPGGSLNFTFEAPESGEVYYRCEVHPTQMMGELEVE